MPCCRMRVHKLLIHENTVHTHLQYTSWKDKVRIHLTAKLHRTKYGLFEINMCDVTQSWTKDVWKFEGLYMEEKRFMDILH